MNRSNNKTLLQNRWLLVICLFAALTHGGFAFFAPDPGDFAMIAVNPNSQTQSPVPTSNDPLAARSPDEREYLELAVSLADKGELRLSTGDVAKRLPLYPALLSIIYRTQSPETWHSAAILLQSLLAWCNTILIALIAAKIADNRAGLIAGLIAALYAPLVYLQTLFLTETVIIFLLLAATLAYLSMLNSNDGQSFQRGVATANSWCHADPTRAWLFLTMTSTLIGLAALARPNAILFLIPFVGHYLLHQIRRRDRFLRSAVLLTLPAVLLLGAWIYRNHQLLGRTTLSTIGGLNLYLGHNADYAENPGLDNADYDRFERIRREQHLTEVEADDQLHADARRFIRENPGQTLRNAFTKIRVWFTPTIPSFGPVLPVLLTCFCAFFAWRSPRDRPASFAKHASEEQGVGNKIGETDQAKSPLYTHVIRLFPPPSWRWIITAAFAAALIAYVVHLTSDTYRKLPFVSPVHVLLLGIPTLLLVQTRPPVRGLFIALISTQLLVAVVYIPLSRIRWTIDSLFIIAIAVATSQLCYVLQARRVEKTNTTPPC